MTDLYSVKDVAHIFSLGESRLRYWAQTGFINPSVRRRGRVFYTFQDLISVRAAKELLDSGLSMTRVRTNLASLRPILSELAAPDSTMRVYSDGDTIAAHTRDIAALPSARIVMDFTIDSLAAMVADLLAQPTTEHGKQVPAIEPIEPGRKSVTPALQELDTRSLIQRADALADELAQELAERVAWDAIPEAPQDDDDTEAHVAVASADPEPPDQLVDELDDPDDWPESAYQAFLAGCEAEDSGDLVAAEAAYRRAVELQPSLASAHTNLGNMVYCNGDATEARACYERALDLEPNQPEARYNLGNVLEDMGELDLAIAELRRVCWAHPEFADAHYNLGLMLAQVGGKAQAQKHLQQYVQLDSDTEWTERAREFLAALQ